MTAVERLLSGGVAYRQAMQVPGRVRLLLLDSPAVLGRAEMRRLEGDHGDAGLPLGVREALAASSRRDAPARALASLLSAMFERAALDVSEGGSPEEEEATIQAIIVGVFGF